MGGSATDYLVHKADQLNHFPVREALPDIIGEHIGNFGLTAVPLFILGSAAAIAKKKGLSTQKQLEQLTKIAFVGAVFANFVSEHQFLKDARLATQNVGDLAMGGLALVTAAAVIEAVDRRLNHTPNSAA